MKIKDNFVLQAIADEFIVVPIADDAERLHGIIKLNETGAFLWKYLSEHSVSKDELAHVLQAQYGIQIEKAIVDTDDFINQIDGLGCIEKE